MCLFPRGIHPYYFLAFQAHARSCDLREVMQSEVPAHKREIVLVLNVPWRAINGRCELVEPVVRLQSPQVELQRRAKVQMKTVHAQTDFQDNL